MRSLGKRRDRLREPGCDVVVGRWWSIYGRLVCVHLISRAPLFVFLHTKGRVNEADTLGFVELAQ